MEINYMLCFEFFLFIWKKMWLKIFFGAMEWLGKGASLMEDNTVHHTVLLPLAQVNQGGPWVGWKGRHCTVYSACASLAYMLG
jgi:hypothetical protein